MTYMKYVSVESGKVQTVEDWEEYFVDPLQWWDNRFYKVSLGISLDYQLVDVRKLQKK